MNVYKKESEAIVVVIIWKKSLIKPNIIGLLDHDLIKVLGMLIHNREIYLQKLEDIIDNSETTIKLKYRKTRLNISNDKYLINVKINKISEQRTRFSTFNDIFQMDFDKEDIHVVQKSNPNLTIEITKPFFWYDHLHNIWVFFLDKNHGIDGATEIYLPKIEFIAQ
jgi:hypothetical protein